MIFYWEPDGSFKLVPQNDYEKGFLKHIADFNGQDFTLIANDDPALYGIRFKPIENEKKS